MKVSTKKIYYFGIVVFIISFFVPAIRMFHASIKGYKCALFAFSAILEGNGMFEVAFGIFINFTNIITFINFFIQLKKGLDKIFITQLLAIIPALYWFGFSIYSGFSVSDFLIGYWLWLAGLLILVLSAFFDRKKYFKNRCSRSS